MTTNSNVTAAIIALALAIINFIVLYILTFFIACRIDRPIVIDPATGEEHAVMAFGQNIILLTVATISSLIILVRSFKYLNK